MTRTSKRPDAAGAVAILALSGVAAFRAGALPDPRVAVVMGGTDERVAVDEYVRVVQFYMRLIRNADAEDGLR
jgi:hypothetical protein